MLVAQKLNNNSKQTYGSYIIGRDWYFLALVGKDCATSKDFSCVDEEIFDTLEIVKRFRVQIK